MNRAERDKAIAADFRNGATRSELAARYGLTPRRISQIAASHGVHRYHADQVAIGLHCRGGRPRDRALIALGPDYRHYLKLRRIMGAAYAREALGVSA